MMKRSTPAAFLIGLLLMVIIGCSEHSTHIGAVSPDSVLKDSFSISGSSGSRTFSFSENGEFSEEFSHVGKFRYVNTQIQTGSPPAVDILFVLDTSFSMEEEIQGVKDKLGKLIDELAEAKMDFHIALVDMRAVNYTGEDYRLIDLPNGKDFAPNNEADLLRVTQALSQIVVPAGTSVSCSTSLDPDPTKPKVCGGQEAGIETASRTVQRLLSPNLPQNDGGYGFLRPETNLSIVFVSDEGDQNPGLLDQVVYWAGYTSGVQPVPFSSNPGYLEGFSQGDFAPGDALSTECGGPQYYQDQSGPHIYYLPPCPWDLPVWTLSTGWANGLLNAPTVEEYLQSGFGSKKGWVQFHAIVPTDGRFILGLPTDFDPNNEVANYTCPSGNGTINTGNRNVGYRYMELARRTGGAIGSICSTNDYGPILEEIGSSISNKLVFATASGGTEIEVKLNGSLVPLDHYDVISYDPVTIKFKKGAPPVGSSVEIYYTKDTATSSDALIDSQIPNSYLLGAFGVDAESVKLFSNGQLIAASEVTFDSETNSVILKNPVAYSGTTLKATYRLKGFVLTPDTPYFDYAISDGFLADSVKISVKPPAEESYELKADQQFEVLGDRVRIFNPYTYINQTIVIEFKTYSSLRFALSMTIDPSLPVEVSINGTLLPSELYEILVDSNEILIKADPSLPLSGTVLITYFQ